MLSALVSLALGVQLRSQRLDAQWATFDEFSAAFGREYEPGSREYRMRKDIFERHAMQVNAHNSKPSSLWTAGLNEFSDWTPAELKSLRGLRGVRGGHPRSKGTRFLDRTKVVADQVDWSHLKSLQKAPNQGGCGSCWAFASVTMLDAAYEIATNHTKKFSPQQLVDCVDNPDDCGGQGGCLGATVELAMDYVQSLGLENLQVRSDYQYKARDGHCPKKMKLMLGRPHHSHHGHGHDHDISTEQLPDAQLVSYQTLDMNEAAPLKEALMHGPVAVAAAANAWSWYAFGIFDGCTKANDWVVNHAVLAIGFGKHEGSEYWKILNSWGSHWGENGKIRLLRAGSEEPCGTDDHPEDGVECKPYPSSVTTCGQCGVLYDSVAVSVTVV